MKNKAADYTWYIDLDRTTFDTGQYIERVFDTVADLYGNKGITRKILEEFTRQSYSRYLPGSNSKYNPLNLLEGYGISALQAKSDLAHRFRPNEFLYSDTFEILDWFDRAGIKPSILTLGDQEWQAFKLLISPRLGSYDQIIIQKSKGDYLSLHQSDNPVILIDDHEFDLPVNCRQILVDRQNIYSGDLQKVTNLTDIMEMFSR